MIPFMHDHLGPADEVCPRCEIDRERRPSRQPRDAPPPQDVPTPEVLIAHYMTIVRTNAAVQAVATATVSEIRWEIIEAWENADDGDSNNLNLEEMRLFDIAAQACILICREERKATR